MKTTDTAQSVRITGEMAPEFNDILSPEALDFIATLAREFDGRRQELLARRQRVQADIDNGKLPDFLPETLEIREADWKVSGVPADLQDRRVEITGPVDRKMVINAMNSGARTYMADFEDSHAPTWSGTIQGQINLRDAIEGTITFENEQGKQYRLNPKTATLIVRPRGWHLVEKHVLVDGAPISGSLFDFGLYLFHNAQRLIRKGTGPYFYLPKLESHLEARLWNAVFVRAQELLSLPKGTIRVTVLIETLLAAFEMDEIIYELKDHMAGLNCGRWDYIFSFIKRFRNVPGYLFPDRNQIGMTRHCMHSYSLLAIQTCHRRGVHAIGGMAAQIPIKEDPAANQAAMAKVRDDKIREAQDGHDGTWVAHPGLVGIALEQFDQFMPTPNQIHKRREDVTIQAADLLKLPEGRITEQGVRTNMSVGIQYLASWLAGNGCVPINHLMEDAATAEISRTQLWQWRHHPDGKLADGRDIDQAFLDRITTQELAVIEAAADEDLLASGNYGKAAALLREIIENPELEEFLTLRAYDNLA